MGYNVSSCGYLNGKLSIDRAIAGRLYRKMRKENKLAECNLLEDFADCEADESGTVSVIKHLWWCGCNSRDTENLEEILRHTTGSAEILLTWERGDSFSGYSVNDGVVTEKKVKHTLED